MNFLRSHLINEELKEDNTKSYNKLFDKGLLRSSSFRSKFNEKLHNANYAGGHGEIRALSSLIFAIEKAEGLAEGTYPASRLGEIDMIVRTRGGFIMQRCPCCFYLSQGVKTHVNR